MSNIRYMPMMSHGRTDVPYYTTFGFCEHLCDMNADTLIPAFMALLFLCTTLTIQTAPSMFRSINFVPRELPDNLKDTHNSAGIYPFAFLFLASLIPKNPSESLLAFMKQRQVGLIRALNLNDMFPAEGMFLVTLDALKGLQLFMSHNTDVLSLTFNAVIGYAQPTSRTRVFSYAYELIGQLRYAGMNGVQMIEEHLLETSHVCLSDTSISSNVKQYLKFKKEAIRRFGEYWIYTAVLDKEMWNNYSRTTSFKKLRIIATMFASDEMHTLNNLAIDGLSIANHKSTPPYSTIYHTYSKLAEGKIQSSNMFIGDNVFQMIKGKIDQWETEEDDE